MRQRLAEVAQRLPVHLLVARVVAEPPLLLKGRPVAYVVAYRPTGRASASGARSTGPRIW